MKFNTCMKLRVDPSHYPRMEELVARFRIAANAAIRIEAHKIRNLHVANDYRTSFNEVAKEIDRHIREAGCPEANWARHYACINPIKEHVKRMKAGVKKANGRAVRIPRYRNDATYYSSVAGQFALTRNADGDICFMIPTERTLERQTVPLLTTLLGGAVSGGYKTFEEFRVVNTPKVEKYLERYEGMEVGSAILYKHGNGEFYISISWTREYEPRQTTNMLGIDVGKAIPIVVSQVDGDKNVMKQWKYDNGTDYTEAAKEIAAYAAANRSGVAMENLTGLQRSSMHIKCFDFSQISTAIKRECDRIGVRFVSVKAKNTSKRCHSCGYIHTESQKKLFRPTQDAFICQSCGHEDNADFNASINIGQRALKLWT